MNTLVTDQAIAFIAVIEQAGLPALRVAFSIAALVFLYAGVLIFPKRHQFVDRDPNVENDFPVVRHNRLEQILFIWGGLTLVLISILYQVQRARHEQFQITSPKRAREANQQMELTQLQNPQEE